MDINSIFDMSQITGVTGTNSINSEKAQQGSFVGSLGVVNNSNESPHQKALKAFYQVHQRSQITGVPTSEYNQAIAALGLDKGQSFAATDMLNKAGFNTGMPSVSAILRYGNTSTTSTGNLNFLKGGADVLAQRAKVGIIPTVLEANKQPLSTTAQNTLASTTSIAATAAVMVPTHNFYDAAVAMAKGLNQEQLKKPIDQVANQLNSLDYQTIQNQLAKSYMDNLQMKQSIESLDTLLG
jgi:hypothetical protein